MSRPLSSPIYGYEDDPIVQTSAFTHDISEKMRVPKRIRATGEYFDDNELLANGNGIGGGNGAGVTSAWNYMNKLDMQVPDRIIVAGQDQHLVLTSGLKSAPREIMFDNTVMPKDQGFQPRVQTPPRNITMAEHRFPTASDEPVQFDVENDVDEYENRSVGSVEERGRYGSSTKNKFNGSELKIKRYRDSTPPLNSSIENLTPSEELLHLRRQVAKLNRRVLTIEMENVNKQQREKILYCVGVAYLLLKTFMWLNRK